MNLTTPLLKGIIRGTELPGDSVTSPLQKVDGNTGLFAGDDGGLGMVMSGLAGVAAALAVAILLSVYFRTGYRTAREVVRHVLTAAFVLALLAFVAYDMRQAALAYLGINPAKGRRPHRHRPPTGRPNGRPMTGSGGRSSIPRSGRD